MRSLRRTALVALAPTACQLPARYLPARHQRGAARPGLVVLTLILVFGLALAWLFTTDGKRAPAVAQGGVSGEVVRPANAGAELNAAPTKADSAADLVTPRAAAVAVGVRVSGDGNVAGRVLERETNLAVAGARVELLPVPPAGQAVLGRMLRMLGTGDELWKRVQPIAVAVTDANGEYEFRGVRRGTYFLEAHGEWHVAESVVRVQAKKSADTEAPIAYMLPAGKVAGTVYSPDGASAARAKLALVPGPGSFLTVARNGDVRFLETQTDDTGRYVFEGVMPGDGYEISVSSDAFALSHAKNIRVVAGQVSYIDVRARAGASIVGRVVSEDEAGNRTPVAGAHLGAVPRGLRNLRCVEEVLSATHCETDANGAFTMTNIPAGDVDVIAISTEHLPAIGARASLDDGATLALDDLVLPRGAKVRGRVVDARGQPLPGVAMRWNLVDWSNFGFDFSLAPLMAQAVKGFALPTTDAEGRFEAGPIAGKAPYSIDFEKLGYVKTELKWDPSKDSGEALVTMYMGSSVSGVVMDAVKSEPVAAFTIDCSDRVDMDEASPSAMNPFSGGQLVEDPAGRFTLDSVRAGKVNLTISATGYLPTSLEVEVKQGEPLKGLIVELTPGGVVRGRVVNEDGLPIAGAQVVAQTDRARAGNDEVARPRGPNRERDRGRARGMASGMAMGRVGRGPQIPPGLMAYASSMGFMGDRMVATKSDGTFEVSGIEAGSFRVHAFHRQYCGASSSAQTMGEQGEVANVVLVLKEGGGVEGYVRDPRGNPVPDEIVVAVAPQSLQPNSSASVGGMYQGSTDAQGYYRIEHVAPGSYFVLATRGDEELNPMSLFGGMNFDLVTVPESETVRFDLVDTTAGGCRVYGTITWRGEPVPRGMLSALNYETNSMLGVEWRAARMKGEGQYEFAGLAPGEYQLNFDGNGPQSRMTMEVPDLAEVRIDLELPEGGVKGLVLNEEGGPVPGSSVSLRSLAASTSGGGMFGSFLSRESRTRRASVNEQGEFEFDRLEAGNYELVATGNKSDYSPSEPVRATVVASRVEGGVVLRLLPALVIKGVVVDEAGAAIADARLVATKVGEGAGAARGGATAKSAADGSFEVRGLGAGAYTLTATAPERASTRVTDIQLQRGKDSPELRMVLLRGTKIVARVRDARGAPVMGARGRVVPKDSASEEVDPEVAGAMLQQFFSGEGGSNEEGLLDLGRYAAGEWRVEVQRTNARGTKVVKVDGRDGEATVEVELQ